jgi:hypothetical protein
MPPLRNPLSQAYRQSAENASHSTQRETRQSLLGRLSHGVPLMKTRREDLTPARWQPGAEAALGRFHVFATSSK